MFAWIEANTVSFLMVGLIVVICAAIVIKGVYNMAKGKSSCGCGCSECSSSMSCAVQELEKYEASKH